MSTSNKNVLAQYPDYEATIGIEVHVQLKTNSKIFCSCPNKFGQAPNSNVCAICAGHPGTLPVLNKKVVDFAIKAGLATNCVIRDECDFARKHYYYPDLPKNYQITQDKKPICQNGFLAVQCEDGNEKNVRIARIHMEEDAGKNIHGAGGNSLVDLNRAGTPLLEIVTQPDMVGRHEAISYLTRLHALVRYLGISDANMEEGSFRADVNISIKRKDEEELGTRTELKNINSFKFISQAIDYELERQMALIMDDEEDQIKQETRLWDNKKNKTFVMRAKADAQDYKYFTDPDLPVISVDQAWLDQIQKEIPELPAAKFKRLQEEHGLSAYEADILVTDQAIADYFETAAAACGQPKLVCNWVLRDILGHLKEEKKALSDIAVTPELLAELVTQIHTGVINSKAAQEVFAEMLATGKKPSDIIKEKGLEQIGSVDELEAIVKELVAKHPDNVAQFKAGKERMLGFFVGQAMKATKGKGNPKILTDLFKKHMG